MVIYTDEKDLRWHKLLDRGLEVALVAHADPGQTHGECIGLSRAFDLARNFGAIPIDHILSYELMVRYPEQFRSMMDIAGSNHTWLSTTLCIYTGDGKKDIRPRKDRYAKLLGFGFVEETSSGMDVIVTPGVLPHHYRLFRQTLKKYLDAHRDEIKPFIYVNVPAEREGVFNVVQYPHYELKKQGNMGIVEVDWKKASEIPKEQLRFGNEYNFLRNSSLLPNFLNDGFEETDTTFENPTLGFFAPAESYSSQGKERRSRAGFNYWRISTRGEAVIIQRPLG